MLTDEEREILINDYWATPSMTEEQLCENVERAVLAKVEKKEGAAIMVFCGNFVGALDAGFIDSNQMTIAQLYQCARNHVKDNYDMDTKTLEEEVGKEFYDKCAEPSLAKAGERDQQVIGRVHYVDDRIYGCLNSIGRELTDGAPLYAHPLPAQAIPEGWREIVEAVAHIGIDFGYGKYELEQDKIEKARDLIEKLENPNARGG